MYERIETTIKWPLDLDPITILEFVDKVATLLSTFTNVPIPHAGFELLTFAGGMTV